MRIGKLIVCDWQFTYDGRLYTIQVYLDVIEVIWKQDGSIDHIQVNQVFQPYEYLAGVESYYKRVTMPGDKIPIEVSGAIKYDDWSK